MKRPWLKSDSFLPILTLSTISPTGINAAPTSAAGNAAKKSANCEIFDDWWDIHIQGGFDSSICDRWEEVLKQKLPDLNLNGATCLAGSAEGNGQITLPTTKPQNVDIFNEMLQQLLPDVTFGNTGLCVPRTCYTDFVGGVKNMTCAHDSPSPPDKPAENESTPYNHNKIQLPGVPMTAVCVIHDYTKFEADYPKLEVDPRVVYSIAIGSPFSQEHCSIITSRLNDEAHGYVIDRNKALLNAGTERYDDKITELQVKVYPSGLSTLNRVVRESWPEVTCSNDGVCGPDQCYFVNGTYQETMEGRKAALKVRDETCAADTSLASNTTTQVNLTETATAVTAVPQMNVTEANTTAVIKREVMAPSDESNSKTLAPLPNKHVEANDAVCFGDTPSSEYMVVVGKPFSETECSRLRKMLQDSDDSKYLDFSCMDNGGWTSHFKGEAVMQLGFGFAIGDYSVINRKLKRAWPDMKFEGPSLCTYQLCYLPTSDDYISVRNATCGLEETMFEDLPHPAANSTDELAPLPSNHLDPNTAICWNEGTDSGQYRVTVASPYSAEECRRVKNGVDSHLPANGTDHADAGISCVEPGDDDFFRDQKQDITVLYTSIDDKDVLALNEGLEEAYPHITPGGYGFCAPYDCYQKTSDSRITVKDLPCAARNFKKRTHMDLLSASLNSSVLPTANLTTNATLPKRELAALPDRNVRPGHAICYTQGRFEHNYQLFIANAYSREACRTFERLLKSVLGPKDMPDFMCSDGKILGSDYFTTSIEPATEVHMGRLNECHIDAVNKALQQAFSDVAFADDGICSIWGCYDQTSHDKINVKNEACARDTSLARETKVDREHEKAAAAQSRIQQGPNGKTSAELTQELEDAGYATPKPSSNRVGKNPLPAGFFHSKATS